MPVLQSSLRSPSESTWSSSYKYTSIKTTPDRYTSSSSSYKSESRYGSDTYKYTRHLSLNDDVARPSATTTTERKTSMRQPLSSYSRYEPSSYLPPRPSVLDSTRKPSIVLASTVDDIRKKYSPSNYVPNYARKYSSDASSNARTSSPSIKETKSPARSSISQKRDLSITRSSKSISPSVNSIINNTINNRSQTPRISDTIETRRNHEEKHYNNASYSHSSTANNKLGLNGLRNIGNTCFMNSVIQCLSNTRYLLDYIREDKCLNDINTTTSRMKGALIKAFSTVIQELWLGDYNKVVNTTALKSQIQRFAPRFMGYAQQDAQEFLRYLLEGLHEDVNRVKTRPTPDHSEISDTLSDGQKSIESWNRYLRIDDSLIVDIFVGQLKSTLKCTVCGHCSVTFDPFWDLSMSISSSSLSTCFEHFTREETLDGHEKPVCAKCQQRRKCTKSFSIQKFPKVLVIHLKRFSPTEQFRGKLNMLVDFPLQVDLSSYAATRSPTDSSIMYNLYAVSNHSGTTYSGHYTAYCKHPFSGEWHEYNDSRVSSIYPRNVVSSEAYVLFYELSSGNVHI